MNELLVVKNARLFATERHRGQNYGDDLPYTWHLGKVAHLAMRLGYSEPVQVAGWLHDTVEDTNTDIEEIRQKFGHAVAVMVDAVTYTRADVRNGIDKIDKARSNPASHVVKFCDASVNFSAGVLDGAPERMGQWYATVERYGTFISRLHHDLPTPEEVDDWLLTIDGDTDS